MSAFTLGDLRKKADNSFASIAAAIKKTNSYEKDDDGFFKLDRDKAGNGSAVLRFLPNHPDDELPWVQLYSHAFQGASGKWYIENSRTTINEEDPVSQLNSSLWKTGLDSDKEIARKQKRRTHYIANVLVVSNPAKPELEGTVMRFKFGKKIFQKLQEAMSPEFADIEPISPFDPINGANFKLRMRQADGFPNYDKSEFGDKSPIAKTDEDILEILNKIEPLGPLVAPDKFKSFDELKTKLDSVLHGVAVGGRTAEEVAASLSQPSTPPRPVGKTVSEPAVTTNDKSGDDNDDIENYFKSMSTE